MAATIKINGTSYHVVETLSTMQVGLPAKVVSMGFGKEAVAVKQCGRWRFWGAEDRLAPRGKIVGQEG